MKHKTYMVLLVDREHAKMFTLLNGAVLLLKEMKADYVPKTVKHVGDVRDARDQASRHVELFLNKHLTRVGKEAELFATENNIEVVLIGTHKPLFGKVKKNLPEALMKKVRQEFVTELKGPFGEILKKVNEEIVSFEEVKIDEE